MYRHLLFPEYCLPENMVSYCDLTAIPVGASNKQNQK